MTESQYEKYQEALDKFHKDIDCYNVVSCYLRLYQYSKNTYHGNFDDHEISVNKKYNEIYVDYVQVTPEGFIEMFDSENESYLRIFKISGINYDDYMNDLPYVQKKLNLPVKQNRIPFYLGSGSNGLLLEGECL